jgi:hypothetical protein
MPTAGWGYGAISNNKTEDFQALLYGHMATYQSRGTFHSTEQLAFTGEGFYRDFLHWPNPNTTAIDSNAKNDHQDVTNRGIKVSATGANDAPLGLGYYGNENDVSYCIVSNILMARMTRWQLVFEDSYRATNPSAAPGAKPVIWLARGAPRRWFTPASGGLNVSNVPTITGRVSFAVKSAKAGEAVFTVVVKGAAATPVTWKLRVPGKLAGAPQCVSGCKVVATSLDDGVVAVEEATSEQKSATRSFTVSVTYSD